MIYSDLFPFDDFFDCIDDAAVLNELVEFRQFRKHDDVIFDRI